MTPYAKVRLRKAVTLGGLGVILAALFNGVVHQMQVTAAVLGLGFGIGFVLGLVEFFWFDRSLRWLPFVPFLLLKSAIFTLIIYALMASVSLVDVARGIFPIEEYRAWLVGGGGLMTLLESFGAAMVILFFFQLDRTLGPGVLKRLLVGGYRRPRPENRIFMFLDMRSSTALAERLGNIEYLELLDRAFNGMTGPILETGAEVYQYVGDEAVLTWRVSRGLRNGDCVRALFRIREEMHKDSEIYLSRWGHVPEFKAGLHAGEVVSAQIGGLKREVVYSGDVLNTTARIRSLCGELGEDLLVSRELQSQVELPPGLETRPVESVSLRGKEREVGLVAIADPSWT